MVRLACYMYDLSRVLAVLQSGCDMESSSPPEPATIVGRDNDWESARDGIGVDAER